MIINTIKIRISTGVVILAEVTQLLFILLNSEYYSKKSGNCPLSNINDGSIKDNIMLFSYRFITFYLPFVTLLWMTWISNSDAEMKFSDVRVFIDFI